MAEQAFGMQYAQRIILIGASMGGTEALPRVLRSLPEDTPGICIVQHMPAVFTDAFAQRLDRESRISVREARDGDRVEQGQALVAPGGFHTHLRRAYGGRYFVELKDGPLVMGQKPAADILFQSAARLVAHNCLAIVLTGMGRDGAEGLLQLRQVGARTIAQDRESSAIYGMPQKAWELGGAERQVSLDRMYSAIVAFSQGRLTSVQRQRQHIGR
ncbi:MAG: CheB methylesterase domain-containing protein [Candidatus Sumerlaeota bacterium]